MKDIKEILFELGFKNVFGIDPMKTTIEFGKTVMSIEGLTRVRIQDSLEFLRRTDSEMITMLCTLPHVTNHDEVLKAMNARSSIE